MKFKSDSQRRAVFSRLNSRGNYCDVKLHVFSKLNRFSDSDKKIVRIGFKQPEVIRFKTVHRDDKEHVFSDKKNDSTCSKCGKHIEPLEAYSGNRCQECFAKDFDSGMEDRSLSGFESDWKGGIISKKKKFSDDEEKEQIAMRRFKDKDMPKIGAGSDRRVYALDDDKVAKVAKRSRGLEQNIYESDSLLDIMPEYHEGGADYVVVERVDRDDKRSRKFLQPLKDYGHVVSDPMTDHDVNKKYGFERVLTGVDEEHGTDLSGLLNYNFVYNDIVRPRNWGWKNDMPKLLDKAAVSGDYLNREHRRRDYASGRLRKDSEAYKRFLEDERFWGNEWNKVLAERRIARKEGMKEFSAA